MLDAAGEVLARYAAAGRPVKAGARAAGVSERTAYRRRADPEFRRRVAELRAAAFAALTPEQRAAVEGLLRAAP